MGVYVSRKVVEGKACDQSSETHAQSGVSRRSFLSLVGGALALSACGFQLRGQQDYVFKRLAINGGAPQMVARLERVVQDYELIYSLYYSLTGADGTVLIPPSVIALNRAMTYSTQYALAKQQEADLLYRDMQNDAVDQLTRRLAVVRSLHPAPSEQTPGIAPRAPLPTPPL